MKRILVLCLLISLCSCGDFKKGFDDDTQFISPLGGENFVSFWNLNEDMGGRASVSNNLTFVQNGGVLAQSGIIGKAPVFDGTDDYLSLPDNNEFDLEQEDMSLSLWVYPTDLGQTQPLVFKQLSSLASGFAIFIESGTDKVVTRIKDQDSVSIQTLGNSDCVLSGDNWNHVVVRFDRDDNLTISVNTITCAALPIGDYNSNINNSAALILGADNNQSAFFTGRIDAFGVWKKVLSEREVTSLYNLGRGQEAPF